MIDFLTLFIAAAGGLGGPAELWGHIVTDFSNITEPEALAAFGTVILIDLVLAGDNAIVVGALAAGLPTDQRKKVILIGIGAALILRLLFALIVTTLLGIVGLIFAGGILLLWVSWKFWRELRSDMDHGKNGEPGGLKPAKSFAAAAWGVAAADVSMSLDNVLAVAGAAKDHPGIMIVGLIVAVILMGVAANIIAKFIERYKWIAYVGLAVILFVAIKMIYEGLTDPQLGVLTLFG